MTLTWLAGDSLFTLTKIALWLQFAVFVVWLLVSVPVYIGIAHDDPPFGRGISPVLQGCAMALLVDVVLAPAGMLPLIALRGIAKARPWAWGTMLASGILGTMCVCPPLGIITLTSVLRKNVREAFHQPRS